jgi:hypothetical protein
LSKDKIKHLELLGRKITPEMVRQTIEKAALIRWGTHLVRWRYFDIEHENITYHRNAMIPSGLWHLLKRIYVDQDWPIGTTQDKLDEAARAVVEHPDTKIYIYGYYRTDPPRIQWGFINEKTGIAVIYDMEADLVATVFKPVEGSLFFERQIEAVQVDREEWDI